MQLETFNQLARAEAIASIRPCLDVARWVEGVVDGRPYADMAALLQRAETVAEPFTEAEIDAALAHHPRIGERAQGRGAEARLSAGEQAGLGDASAELERALRQGNRDYERKFGRVFLIRAAGRDRAEVLAELRRRMAHDEAEELPVIAAQLREIALGRLTGLIADG